MRGAPLSPTTTTCSRDLGSAAAEEGAHAPDESAEGLLFAHPLVAEGVTRESPLTHLLL